MLDITSHTIVRNGKDVISVCLPSILPYVKQALVWVDGRSNDGTIGILKEFAERYGNLAVRIFKIEDPRIDLIKMRNNQLKHTTTQWVWIVDSDEYYEPETCIKIDGIISSDKGEYDSYALRCWSVYNEEHGHKASSRAVIQRIFKYTPTVCWQGVFGYEKLYNGGRTMFYQNNPSMKILPLRYVHFSFFKGDLWREEMQKQRVPVTETEKFIYPLPPEIIKIVQKVYANKTQNHTK